MDGVALCARFSIATNRLQYCGPADAEPALYAVIVRGERREEARDALARFEALMPYLEAIGRAHELDPFDPEVVEAYWIGNDLVDTFGPERFRALLTDLTHRGLPPSVARRLAHHLPDRPLPHHAFHVAFVGVGAVTGHVPTTLDNIEACRPAWATVRTKTDDRLTVVGPAARAEEHRLALDARRERTIPYDPKVLPEVAVGDAVAVHWSWPALRLTADQDRRLREYTARSFAVANESLPGLGVL